MTAPTRFDPDVELVERVRAIVGPRFPIVLGLDYHANLGPRLLRRADALFVDTPDWGPADVTTLSYRHVPRDRVYPFIDGE